MRDFQYPFVIYEKAMVPGEWPRMLADAAKAGFDGLEISVDESDARLARLDWGDRECLSLITDARQAGVRLQSLCFSGQRRFPMGSADPAVEAKSLDMMRKCIVLCQNLGVRVLQVAGYDVYYEPGSDETYRRYAGNLEKMTRIAEKHGVTLAIEPVEKGVLSVRMALDIVERIRSPFLQIYPDIANMTAHGIDYFSEIRLGIGHIVQMHVRDAIRDYFYGVDIGTGIIDFVKTFRLFDEVNLSCPLTLEMWNLENERYMEVIVQARRFLLDKIAQARKDEVKRDV